MIESVWTNDAFSMYQLTSAVNNQPTKPQRTIERGIFTSRPIPTTYAVLENVDGVISLVPNTERGTPGGVVTPDKPNSRVVAVTHLPLSGTVKADDVLNVRKFATSDPEVLQGVSDLVDNVLFNCRTRIEATREHLLVGALQGLLKDADGTTTILNLYDLYGTSRIGIDFDLGTAGTDVRVKCLELKRAMEDELGQSWSYDYPWVYCSDTFFDAFISHGSVKDSYQNWASNEANRSDNRAGFFYGGCYWENYDPKIGNYHFIPDGDGAAFPIGTNGEMFLEHFGPANYMDSVGVGASGEEYYASLEPMKHNKGADIETQSNPLPVCVRPTALIRAFSST